MKWGYMGLEKPCNCGGDIGSGGSGQGVWEKIGKYDLKSYISLKGRKLFWVCKGNPGGSTGQKNIRTKAEAKK